MNLNLSALPYLFISIVRRAIEKLSVFQPVHLHHFLERVECFIIICIGESAFGAVNGFALTAENGDGGAYASVIFETAFAMLTVFVFKMFYFNSDNKPGDINVDVVVEPPLT